jgi:hypothetical protein
VRTASDSNPGLAIAWRASILALLAVATGCGGEKNAANAFVAICDTVIAGRCAFTR